jgi:hypothetical protein
MNMAGRDYSEYEQRRAYDHEINWRFAATAVNVPQRICRYRQCRRFGACIGPMLPSHHQSGAVRAQQAIGLSGKACADLPLCMTDATAQHYAHMCRVSEQLQEDRRKNFKDCNDIEFLRELQLYLRTDHRNKAAALTSPARQPTSEPEEKG